MVNRLDVEEGRVGPKTLENGVVVPASLRINELTLEEHRRHLRNLKALPLSAAEEARLFPDEAPAPEADPK